MTGCSVSARARVRAEITAEIVDAARAELAEVGPVELSLRSVARRLGVVPSALYRYFESRDALLTALIVDAYRALGETAAAADRSVSSSGRNGMARWLAVCTAVRDWAGDHPHQWALIYGSPVPGYEAPEDTVEAALGITRVVTRIISDSTSAPLPVDPIYPPLPDGFLAVVEPLRTEMLPGAPGQTVAGTMLAWTALLGSVSLEQFGHYKGGTTDFALVFRYVMEVAGRAAGIPG